MNNKQNIKTVKNSSETLLLIFSLAIFVLNDLIFFFHFYSWFYYVADYLLKGLIVIGIILVINKNPSNKQYLKISRKKILPTIGWTISLIILGLLIDQWLWRILDPILPSFSVNHFFPNIQSPILNIFDLTFGLILVAITEEYIFRYLIIEKLNNILPNVISIVIAAIIFGLAHWSFGTTAIIIPILWGLISAVSVQKMKSLIPVIIAHYIVDIVAFSGVLNGFF